MAQTSGREIAVETLLLITQKGEYSHIVLKNVLDKYQYLEKKERAFITRVVDGTLERMIELDYIIDQFSKVKTDQMKPVIRTILRSSVYQLKYMDSVPDSAVCNEAVKLAVKKGFGGLKGFVNGVLRSIGRNIARVKYPERNDIVSYISIKYSLPEWILRQWLDTYDVNTVIAIGEEFLKEKPLSIRCDTSKISADDLQKRLKEEGALAELSGELPYALYLTGYDHLAGLKSFRDGLFYVQDISSMQVAEWADPKEGSEIIDVCAAPGGKALHLAQRMRGTGHVTACDVSANKVMQIEENIERSRLENIDAFCWDATVCNEAWVDAGDIVIADLPCSGLGVLGKKPDLKYRMTQAQQRELVMLQRKILSNISAYVKPGGVLLYSTCTICREENEENAAWFAEMFPWFKLLREQQMLPGRDAGDGFYIAMFQRENA